MDYTYTICKETDRSAAAMAVGVGSFHDDWEIPGLAHFCEHMLFMGTSVRYVAMHKLTVTLQALKNILTRTSMRST